MVRNLPFLDDENFPTLREVPAFHMWSRIPVKLVEEDELPPSAIDHREGFILALIDGVSTVDTLVDVAAMPAEETITVLLSLVDRGIVALD